MRSRRSPRREEVELLVIGEPRMLDGKLSETAQRIRRFGARLARAARLPVERVEETLTTVEASQRLAEAGFDRPDRSSRLDAVAAQILLQEALDRRANENGNDEKSSGENGERG